MQSLDHPVQHKKRERLLPPPLPREHGGWAMLLVPLFVGGLIGGSLSPIVLLTILAAFFAYLCRPPLVLLALGLTRGEAPSLRAALWLAAFAGASALAGIPLLLRFPTLLPLVALAAVLLGIHLYLTLQRSERGIGAELLGIAGLSLGAPATYHVATGSLDGHMMGLWLLNFLYFGGTVLYVRLKVRIHSRQEPPASPWQKLRAARTALAYHVGAMSLAIVLVGLQVVPVLAPLVYVPVTCKAFQGALDWRQRPNVKRIGILEIAHSLVFAVLLVVAHRWPL